MNWKAEADLWRRNAEHLGDKYQAVCIALGIDKNALKHEAVERALACRNAYDRLRALESRK